MSPLTHLLASWIVAVKTTNNLRDERLVTLAGVAPDLDGLGIIIDIANGSLARGNAYYYPRYHHWLAHGLPAALVVSALLATFARGNSHGLAGEMGGLKRGWRSCAARLSKFVRQRWRTFLLCFAVFHFHLFCDWIGSHGPGPGDYWYIFYLGPFRSHPMWVWQHQWPLDGWQNQVITFVLLFWSLWLAVQKGNSVVSVFSERADKRFVAVLRKWATESGLARRMGWTF
jgi:inner membrane protein